MGVSISSLPAAAFSQNRIVATFTTDTPYENEGVLAVNDVYFTGSLSPNIVIELRWGENLQRFTAKIIPLSNNEIPSGNGQIAHLGTIKTILEANFYVNRDFTLEVPNDPDFPRIIFTAKRKEIGLNFSPYVFQSGSVRSLTNGVAAKLKQNHGVKLECQVKRGLSYETIYDERLPFGGRTSLKVDIASLLHAELKPDFPGSWAGFAPIRHTASALKYRLRYAEASAQVGTPSVTTDKNVVWGGNGYRSDLNTIPIDWVRGENSSDDRALRHGSNMRVLQIDEPAFLTFFNTRAAYAEVNVRIRVEYQDDSLQTYNYPALANVSLYEKITFDVSFLGLNVPAVNPEKGVKSYYVSIWSGSTQLLQEYRYFIDYANRESKRFFVFWNSVGAWDSFCTYGKAASETKYTSTQIETVLAHQYSTNQGVLSDSKITSQRNFSVASGNIGLSQINLFEDFKLSRYKYEYVGGQVIPIVVSADSLVNETDEENFYNHTFQYQYAFKNTNYDG